MTGTRWQLFRLLGIPINVDASWLLIFGLLIWSLTGLFRDKVPDQTDLVYWGMGLAAAAAIFACIVLHELGHAVVAQAQGIRIRGITLFLFGGVAEMEDEPPSARSEFLMAIAGPAVSAALAAMLWALSRIPDSAAVAYPLTFVAGVNLTLLVFNLIPAFPLDGGRVLRALLWGRMGNLRRATYYASLAGQGFALLLIGLGVTHLFAGQVVQGLWLGLIGMFLNNAAQGGYQQVLLRQCLRGVPVSRFMTREPIVVPPGLDLRSWVDDYVYRYHRKLFPVIANGRVEGVIGTPALTEYPRNEWAKHTVGEAMVREFEELRIAPDVDALDALTRMQRTGSSRLLVMDGVQLVGIVSLKDLLGFLDLKLELEGEER